MQKRKDSILDLVFQQFPVLQSGNVALKRIDTDHIEDMQEVYKHKAWNQDRVAVLITHLERDYLKKKTITWGIFVGVMQVSFSVKDKRGWFTYDMNKSLGVVEVGKEAIKMMLAFMFDTVKLTQVVIEIEPDNTTTQSDLLNIGFIYEGSFREVPLRKGKEKVMVGLQMYTFCNA